LLNTAGYFDPLLGWLDHMVREDFLRPKHRDLLLVDDDEERLLNRIGQFDPGPSESKWTAQT
jgi:predicted Rossmann-fold nucleotide-binding protein